MEKDLALVTDWLLCASSQVGEEYVRMPVEGGDLQYRERVYCYELYHRWRIHWPERYRLSLSGEVDKINHPVIPDSPKPDFLIHIPGNMRENLLIMEVKPGSAHVEDMVTDLKKLTSFRKSAGYLAAYFWVYGCYEAEWSTKRKQINDRVAGCQEVDITVIRCFLHEKAGTKAFSVDW